MDEYIWRPVMAGHWRQHELWDGTYTIIDLFDVHEMMDVMQENERRANAAALRKQRMNG